MAAIAARIRSAPPGGGGRLGERDHKLFAAPAPAEVCLAQLLAQQLPNRGQDGVARGMAPPIVDVLEVIDIHQQQAEGIAVTLRAGDLAQGGGRGNGALGRVWERGAVARTLNLGE
jgi:hypothetical protein